MTRCSSPAFEDSALAPRSVVRRPPPTRAEVEPTVITICCPSYSGSTMLDLMLGNGEDGFSCGEVGFWYWPIERRHRTLACSCAQTSCPIWQRLLSVRAAEFHRYCLQARACRFVIDSTKRLAWTLNVHRWSRHQGLRATNLVVWKSPEMSAYSWWKRGKPIAGAVDRYLRYFTQLRETGLPTLAISYERLVTNPAEQLRDLCDLLGMEYFPGKERFWEQTAHLAFGNAGTRDCLRSGTPEIRSEERLPQEFRREFAQTMTTELRSRTDDVQLWLERHDVTFADQDRVYDRSTPLRWPRWYYQHRVSQQLRTWAGWYR